MIIINTINTQRFSLNGIPYYKNFTGVVYGNKLKVVNVYDSKLCLSELKDYDQYQVNGVIYGSVALLQSALLPVIFTRDTLGSSDAYTPYSEEFIWEEGNPQVFTVPDGITPKNVFHNKTLLRPTEYTVDGSDVEVTYVAFDPVETNIVTITN